jgi:hypothetical protein
MGAVMPRGAGDGPGVQVDAEAVLGEVALPRGRRLHLDAGVQAGLFYLFEELAGSVGGITVDCRPAAACSGLGGGVIGGQQVSEQRPGHLGVPAVAWRDGGGGDDLAIRVDRDVPLVAVEPAGGGLAPVPGLRVDGGDNPVRGDLPRDPERPGGVLFQVLAGHGGQQRRRLRQHRAQLPPVHGTQQRAGVAGQRVHQLLACRSILVVADRLARGHIIVVAGQHCAQPPGQLAVT